MGVQRQAPRRRMEPDARRAEILGVARRLFGARSYSTVSIADIAAEAGVARALVSHYFGGKRQLYLEVVRQMMVVPASVSARLPPTTAEERISICVDRWLEVVERNREMWLSAIGLEALGNDPEIDRIMLDADEIATDRVLEAAMMTDVTEGREKLRAMIRAHSGMLKAASREWLVRGTLSRSDLHVMLTRTVLHLVHTVFPALRDG
ncbi:TetR/AcrR family transcriptional regulator [Streptomyces capillispiralis]|uniref:TetR family transcriptional regulator n=1 Tax=Streptomyces capillispiralis TaxID=68182 RepID=A0A561TBT0_9ACTN|nr:TetR/AcrR family transcriptional regulator [Streptomyces capillispiralis]TWF84580.1 TetR family transcriptional regulator [Streptomyces capillispiralis]GHH92126.1 TetR family transcriptional regulator [Streptomyces capillispiralis]